MRVETTLLADQAVEQRRVDGVVVGAQLHLLSERRRIAQRIVVDAAGLLGGPDRALEPILSSCQLGCGQQLLVAQVGDAPGPFAGALEVEAESVQHQRPRQCWTLGDCLHLARAGGVVAVTLAQRGAQSFVGQQAVEGRLVGQRDQEWRGLAAAAGGLQCAGLPEAPGHFVLAGILHPLNAAQHPRPVATPQGEPRLPGPVVLPQSGLVGHGKPLRRFRQVLARRVKRQTAHHPAPVGAG